jgi:hypothetical protein
MTELMIVLRRMISRAPLLMRRETRSEDILAFLTGRSSGEQVLHALYDHIVDEAVPPRLSEIVFRHQSDADR